MKKNIQYTACLFLVFSACIFTGCNKQLDDLAPHNVLFEDQEFSTSSGFTKVTIGNYNAMTGSAVTAGGYDNDCFLLDETRGNNIRVVDRTSTNTSNDVRNTDAFNFLNSTSKDFGLSDDFWKSSYKIMLGINTVLSHVSATETDPIILQAKAENLFLRAVLYFNLVRLYGRPYYQSPSTNLGVPLILAPVASVNDKPTRATVEATYAQIISDLTTAAKTFTQTKVNSFASKYAAYALLSRVYLYMSGTFAQPNTANAQLASKYADSVIMNGGYALLTGTAYTAMYTSSNQANTETIWAINHDVTTTPVPTLLYQPTGVYAGNTSYSTGQFKPSPDLLGLMQTGDLRKNFYFTDKYPNNTVDTLSTKKYQYKYTTVYNSYAPYNYLRLAETYLNRAEAKVKNGDNVGAIADVNVIRTRNGLPAAVGLTGQSLFDEIMVQRRLELAFEGHNSFDYFRNGLPMVRSYTSFNSAPLTVNPTDGKVVLQISQDILTENGNIVQNGQ